MTDSESYICKSANEEENGEIGMDWMLSDVIYNIDIQEQDKNIRLNLTEDDLD